MNIAIYEGYNAGSYIPTPYINRSIININSGTIDDCFELDVLGFFYPVTTNPQRPLQYRKLYSRAYNEYQLDFRMCPRPMPIDKIFNFEKGNPNISVCVYEKNALLEKPTWLYRSQFIHKRQYHINLLMLTDGDKSHYCLIRDFDKFCNTDTNHNAYFFCDRCMYKTKEAHVMQKHYSMCSMHKAATANLPTEGNNIMEFKHYERKQKHPWVAVFDYEAFHNLEVIYNKKLQPIESRFKHVESGVGYYYNKEYKSFTTEEGLPPQCPSKFLVWMTAGPSG